MSSLLPPRSMRSTCSATRRGCGCVALLAQHELTVAELTADHPSCRSRASRRTSAGCGGGRAARPPGRQLDASTRSTTARCRARPPRLDAARARASTDATLETDRERCEALLRGPRARPAVARRARGRDGAALLAGPHLGGARARRLVGLLAPRRRARRRRGRRRDRRAARRRARSRTRCLDRSERMLAAAQARLANARRTCASCTATCTRSRRRPRRSTRCCCCNVLAVRRATRRVVLAEVARVLRPGGGVALVTLDEHAHAELDGAVRPRAARLPAGRRCKPARAARGLVVERCEVTSRERREPHLKSSPPWRTSPSGNGVIAMIRLDPTTATLHRAAAASASSSSTAPWAR